jgi:hypothetical protein
VTTATHPPRALLEEILEAAGDDAPESVDALLALPKIKVFTDALKASEVAGKRAFRCTASSTITDLHGDYMTEECVRDMAAQAKRGPTGKGLTIFLNHKYNIPEDVAGKVAGTQVLTRAKDDNGADIWDMDYDVVLAKGPEGGRLDQVWSLIADDEITMGISIGAYILEYDFIDKDEGFWGGLIINKVLLVETSIVGIPANQRSWVQNGVIAIGKSLGFAEKQIRRVLDGKETSPLMKTASLKDGIDVPAITVTDDGERIHSTTKDADGNVVMKSETFDTILTRLKDTATKETCPECGGNSDKCDCKAAPSPVTESVESTEEAAPEVTADAAPATESTDEQPTEATAETTDGEITEAAPAVSALAEAAPDIALSLTAGSTPAVELVLAALESAAEMLKTTRTEKATLQAKYDEQATQLEQAIKDRDFAAEIIEIVARSPLGRKTQFQEPVESFVARFKGIYDESYLKLLSESE